MQSSARPPGLFELAQRSLSDYKRELATYGLQIHPGMEIRRSSGIHSYYDAEDRNIYVAIPDPSHPNGKLHKLLMRSLLGCNDDEEFYSFVQLFIPRAIAHELGHHLRRRYGLFDSANLWQEEQIANHFATAMTKRTLSPEVMERGRGFLLRAIKGLEEKCGERDIVTDSYGSFLHALNVEGRVADTTLENIEMLNKVTAVSPEDLLRSSGTLSKEIITRMQRRKDIIEEFNEAYISDSIRYLYYQLGWLYYDLTSRENRYVSELAQLYLDFHVDLLPVPKVPPDPPSEAIKACYKAYQDSQPYSEAGSRYFYKRYRSLLLAKLTTAASGEQPRAAQMASDAALFLENWDEQDIDVLDYLAPFAPPKLQSLFPHLILNHLDSHFDVQERLSEETDIRLWAHISQGVQDPSASNTLHRLELLERTSVYNPLPAEVLLTLVHSLCQVKWTLGEIVIWQGSVNNDIYIITAGELDVLATNNDQTQHMATLKTGEVVGEMAFLTRKPRSATVRAAMPSEGLVLKSSDLQLLALKHPIIPMQMARTLARRLAYMTEDALLQK